MSLKRYQFCTISFDVCFYCRYQKITEREKHDFNKGDNSNKETVEPPVKKPKVLEPLKKGQGKLVRQLRNCIYYYNSCKIFCQILTCVACYINKCTNLLNYASVLFVLVLLVLFVCTNSSYVSL